MSTPEVIDLLSSDAEPSPPSPPAKQLARNQDQRGESSTSDSRFGPEQTAQAPNPHWGSDSDFKMLSDEGSDCPSDCPSDCASDLPADIEAVMQTLSSHILAGKSSFYSTAKKAKSAVPRRLNAKNTSARHELEVIGHVSDEDEGFWATHEEQDPYEWTNKEETQTKSSQHDEKAKESLDTNARTASKPSRDSSSDASASLSNLQFDQSGHPESEERSLGRKRRSPVLSKEYRGLATTDSKRRRPATNRGFSSGSEDSATSTLIRHEALLIHDYHEAPRGLPNSKSQPSPLLIDSDSDESIGPYELSQDIQLPSLPSTLLSDQTTALLNSISASTRRPPANKHGSTNAKTSRLPQGLKVTSKNPESEDTPFPASRPAKKPRLTTPEREAKAQEKAELKHQKLMEKEEKKERKRLMKEQKIRDKETAAALAEANKSRTDKKVSTPEMIVDLSSSMIGTALNETVRSLLEDLGVNTTSKTVANESTMTVVEWRRKVTSRWNEEKGHWEGLSGGPEVKREKHVLAFLGAAEFVEMAIADSNGAEPEGIGAHVRRLKSKYQESPIPIYLIEGLETWMRKNKTLRNRAYQAAVLRETDGNQTTAADASTNKKSNTSKRKKPVQVHVEEDVVEDALLCLQIKSGCLIHHTASTAESAAWIANFTQHISTIPYRYVPSLGASLHKLN